MNIKCQRLVLKRLVAASTALIVYTILDEVLDASYALKYSVPLIILFMTYTAVSFIKFFNTNVNITRDDRYIVVTKGKRQRRYEHNQKDKISYIKAGILANYDELIISLPEKDLHFILSVYEKDMEKKLAYWKIKFLNEDIEKRG